MGTGAAGADVFGSTRPQLKRDRQLAVVRGAESVVYMVTEPQVDFLPEMWDPSSDSLGVIMRIGVIRI
jgi:hypothetical protein